MRPKLGKCCTPSNECMHVHTVVAKALSEPEIGHGLGSTRPKHIFF
jgi:hypothetical protein